MLFCNILYIILSNHQNSFCVVNENYNQSGNVHNTDPIKLVIDNKYARTGEYGDKDEENKDKENNQQPTDKIKYNYCNRVDFFSYLPQKIYKNNINNFVENFIPNAKRHSN